MTDVNLPGITLRERQTAPARLDPADFLGSAGVGKKRLAMKKNKVLFSQGDPADDIFFIEKGRVKLTVVSKNGKEATIALLASGEFAGEDCVAVHSTRLATAITLEDCVVLRIRRKEMLRVLHQDHEFSGVFRSFLLARNARIQADLVDQLFNSSEKRLARVLLLLAQFDKAHQAETVIPHLSQQALAQMVGTTRSRVSFFMNRFRRLGFIQYNGNIQVHSSLLNIILHD